MQITLYECLWIAAGLAIIIAMIAVDDKCFQYYARYLLTELPLGKWHTFEQVVEAVPECPRTYLRRILWACVRQEILEYRSDENLLTGEEPEIKDRVSRAVVCYLGQVELLEYRLAAPPRWKRMRKEKERSALDDRGVIPAYA